MGDVRIYHPELDRESTVPEESLEVWAEVGWQLADEEPWSPYADAPAPEPVPEPEELDEEDS